MSSPSRSARRVCPPSRTTRTPSVSPRRKTCGSAVGRTAVLYPNGNAAARRVVLVGLGPTDELDADAYRTAAASVAEAAERVGGTLAWVLDDSLPLSEQARAVVDGLVLGSYDPGRWKTGAKSDHPFERLVLVGGTDELRDQAERAADGCGCGEPRPRPREHGRERAHAGASRRPCGRAGRGALEPDRRGARARRDHEARNGRVRRSRAGQPQPAAHDRDALRAALAEGRRRARPRRQGDHVRHRRHLDQAGPLHGGHEGRHVRRRCRDRRNGCRGRARSAAAHPGRRRGDARTPSAAAPTGRATS